MSNPEQSLRLATESIPGQRPYQEDAVVTETLSDGRTLVAVADGMGGHAAGEVASALALETLVARLEEGDSLDEAFRAANGQVHTKAKEPGKQGMGTTLVAMVLDGGAFHMANVGDSRAYLLTKDEIRQLTEDHSFVAEAVKKGESAEEVMASRWKDALTRSIGTSPEVKVDVFGPFPVEPDSVILLCSDGLYKTLPDEDLHQLYIKSGGPRGACQSLVSSAYDRGSDDNISIAVVEFGEIPRERPVGTMPLDFEAPDPEDDLEPEPGADDVKKKKKGWWPFGKG